MRFETDIHVNKPSSIGKHICTMASVVLANRNYYHTPL